MVAVKRIVYGKRWLVKREGIVEEVVRSDGTSRFRVSIMDQGRKPFLTRWFNDQVPASDFIDKVAEGYDPREESK